MNRILFALLLSTFIYGAAAHANELSTYDGYSQPIILWNQQTIDAIEIEIAKASPLDEKIAAVKALLNTDAKAVDGFCETAVKLYSPLGQAKLEEIYQNCIDIANDKTLLNAIATGKVSKSQDPQLPDKTLRQKLSELASTFIMVMAMNRN